MTITTVLLALALQADPPAPITVAVRFFAPFISPMGEPYRSHAPGDDTLVNWFTQADRNRDGILTADEFRTDAERFFGVLDSDRDAQIGPEEIRVYEFEMASEIQVNTQWRRVRGDPRPKKERPAHETGYDVNGMQGAARYGLLNMPQPVTSADTDFNRSITLAEFQSAAAYRFQLLDSKGDGKLSLSELQALRPVKPKRGCSSKPPKRDPRIAIPVPLDD